MLNATLVPNRATPPPPVGRPLSRRVAFLLVTMGSVLSSWACGSSTSEAADTDECAPRGASYACQASPSCEASYMPVANVSCGARGGTCCVKGALPPADAATDADASSKDECTPQGMVCQDVPTCEPEFQPVLGVSCGAVGKTCCVKGALPPKDAAAE